MSQATLEVLDGVMVALAFLHITQLSLSSIAWKALVNTQMNVFITSHMDLQECINKCLCSPDNCLVKNNHSFTLQTPPPPLPE